MIVDETDRITSLLSRIETLSSDTPVKFTDVNIHEVLDHCIRITKASFGRHLTVIRRYDPHCLMSERIGNCWFSVF